MAYTSSYYPLTSPGMILQVGMCLVVNEFRSPAYTNPNDPYFARFKPQNWKVNPPKKRSVGFEVFFLCEGGKGGVGV